MCSLTLLWPKKMWGMNNVYFQKTEFAGKTTMQFSFNFISLSTAKPHATSENLILFYPFFEENEKKWDC